MDRIYKTYARLLTGTDLRFTRYLYDQINWDNRLIVIKGARGVGKTTMLLQHILKSGSLAKNGVLLKKQYKYFDTNENQNEGENLLNINCR